MNSLYVKVDLACRASRPSNMCVLPRVAMLHEDHPHTAPVRLRKHLKAAARGGVDAFHALPTGLSTAASELSHVVGIVNKAQFMRFVLNKFREARAM